MFQTLVALFLAALVFTTGVVLFAAVLNTTGFAEGQVAAHASADIILSSIEADLGNAAQLGHCASDSPGVYATAFSACRQVQATGPAVNAISYDGFCFYELPAAETGAAPEYACILEDPSTGKLYQITYPPVPTIPNTSTPVTYTTCDPESCWGSSVASMLPACEADPTLSSCWLGSNAPAGSEELYLGRVDTTKISFVGFIDNIGGPIPVPYTDPNVAMVDLAIAVPESHAPSPTDYTLDAQVAIAGTAYADQRTWEAP